MNDVYQSGIISCLSFNSQICDMYAAGSYTKTSTVNLKKMTKTELFCFFLVGIYGDRSGELIAVLHGHNGGITHIQFSSDGNRLYSGARKVNSIIEKIKRTIQINDSICRME